MEKQYSKNVFFFGTRAMKKDTMYNKCNGQTHSSTEWKTTAVECKNVFFVNGSLLFSDGTSHLSHISEEVK